MATILVVDDELGIRALLSEILADEGHSVELAQNAAEARTVRERLRPDLVLLDIWMPDVDGITLLKEWGSSGLLTMPVIMMSGHGTIDTAVEAIKYGAAAFLEKPVTLQKLLKAVEQGLNKAAGRPVPAAASLPVASSMPVIPLARPVADPGGNGLMMQAHAERHDPHAAGLGMNRMTDVQRTMEAGVSAREQLFDLDRPLREARDAFEKSYFEFHLFKENGSMTRVAEKTGLERTHLYRKLKQLGVDLSRSKRNGTG